MKLIPVAPSLEIADSVVLLKANYPVKRKDLLCLEYRVKAGTTCNLEIKVSNYLVIYLFILILGYCEETMRLF